MVDVAQITKLVKRHFEIKGKWSVNPESEEVDVQGDVIFKGLPESEGMFHVQFGTVSGYFDCNNTGVISLKGAPHTVGRYFLCDFNSLAPGKGLMSLEGGPRIVRGEFSCIYNQLPNLMGAPEQVGGGFQCYGNQLTSLQGAPQVVGGSFTCMNNRLTSLQGGPQQVGGKYDCRQNPKLKSLDGLPDVPANGFYCIYKKDLPLLRLLSYPPNKVTLVNIPKKVLTILEPHMGSGKKGSIACAVELIKAGYKDNARW